MKNELVKFLAKACNYAQSHIDDSEAWPVTPVFREAALQCVSFQIACFLAQNTKEGDFGVESEIILEELIERPMKSEKQWVKILEKKARQLGGWKN